MLAGENPGNYQLVYLILLITQSHMSQTHSWVGTKVVLVL